MKYEFGDERAKRKKRNMIIAAIAAAILLVATGLGYMYYTPKSSVQTTNSNAQQAADSKGQEKTETKASEVKSADTETPANEQSKQITDEPKKSSQYTILIDKSDFSLTLKKDDKVEKIYSVAIGKNSGQKQQPGDLRTPSGEFTVDEIIDSSSWKHDFKDGKGEIEGAYGPWFISLETGWDGIGIHGTHDPASIRTMVSEGCIRMNNDDVEEVKAKIQPGTKVIIQE
mgnify:FL=1